MVVNLSWPSHSRDLTEGIWALFQQTYKTDFEICINGQFISTHHVIMAMFCTTIKESNYNALFLNYDPKILQQDLESVVEFLYRGEIKVEEDRLSPIMDLANQLGFKILSDTIMQSMKPKNVAENVNQSSPCMEIPSSSLETREMATQISPNRVNITRKYKKTSSKVPEYLILPTKTVKSVQKRTNSNEKPEDSSCTSCLSELSVILHGDTGTLRLSELINRTESTEIAMEINSENHDITCPDYSIKDCGKNLFAVNCEHELFAYNCQFCECKTNNRSSFSYHMANKHQMDIHGNVFTSNLWHPH